MRQMIYFRQENAKSKFYGFSMAVLLYLYAINSAMSPLSWNLGGICEKTVLDIHTVASTKLEWQTTGRTSVLFVLGQFSHLTFHFFAKKLVHKQSKPAK